MSDEPVEAVEGSAPVERRPVTVLEAHTVADCADSAACWWLPHRAADQSLPPAPRDGLAGSDEAVEALVGARMARYYPHTEWADCSAEFRSSFLVDVRADLAVVEPFIAARVRAEAVAEERQRIAAAAASLPKPGPESTGYERGYYAAFSFAREPGWAAGFVPVATPEQSARTKPYRACAGCDGPDLCRYCEYPVATPAEPDDREAATAEVRWAARVAENLCHWRQNYLDARTESHWAFHFGNPCPYEVVAAVLRGKVDPRASVEPSVGTGTPAEAGPPDDADDGRWEYHPEMAARPVSGCSGHAGRQESTTDAALAEAFTAGFEQCRRRAEADVERLTAEVVRSRAAIEPKALALAIRSHLRPGNWHPSEYGDKGALCESWYDRLQLSIEGVLAAALGDGPEATPVSFCGHTDAEGCTGHGDF